MSYVAGRRALITGAAVGLGNAYARRLAQAGAHVALCDVRPEVETVAEELRAEGVNAFARIADVSRAEDVRSFVDDAHKALGGIDILISNAGVWGASEPDDDLTKTLDDYERLVGTNLKGVFLCGRAVIPLMIEQGHGEIVNIATDHMVTCGAPNQLCPRLPGCPWGDAPRPTGGGDAMDLYDAAKWGINGLTFAWAKALRPHGIRVNAFCMGATDSYMLRSFHNFDPSPEEVASWMKTDDNAQALLELLEEGPGGRNGDNVNFCVGRPCKLEPAQAPLYVLKEDLYGNA